MTRGAGRPHQPIPDSDLGIKPQGGSELGHQGASLCQLDGMDQQALAYVSRLFDVAQAAQPSGAIPC